MTNELWHTDVSRWIIEKIPTLNDRSKYRAYNSIRFALWAEEFREVAPPVSSFCAMHAVEEAVAAFVSAAKTFGHRESAGKVNIRDHLSKALVSIFASRATLAVHEGKLEVAVHPDGQSLAYRIPKGEGHVYDRLHLSVFHVDFDGTSDAGDRVFLGSAPFLDDIQAEIRKAADTRNEVLYATDKGTPVGFLDMHTQVKRATKLSLGLIWASIDLHLDPAQGGTFIQMMLEKMIELNAVRNNSKKTPN